MPHNKRITWIAQIVEQYLERGLYQYYQNQETIKKKMQLKIARKQNFTTYQTDNAIC